MCIRDRKKTVRKLRQDINGVRINCLKMVNGVKKTTQRRTCLWIKTPLQCKAYTFGIEWFSILEPNPFAEMETHSERINLFPRFGKCRDDFSTLIKPNQPLQHLLKKRKFLLGKSKERVDGSGVLVVIAHHNTAYLLFVSCFPRRGNRWNNKAN